MLLHAGDARARLLASRASHLAAPFQQLLPSAPCAASSKPGTGREHQEIELKNNSNYALKYQVPGMNVAVDLQSTFYQAGAVCTKRISPCVEVLWKGADHPTNGPGAALSKGLSRLLL